MRLRTSFDAEPVRVMLVISTLPKHPEQLFATLNSFVVMLFVLIVIVPVKDVHPENIFSTD